jgi:class 3 adenylate cyclase
LGPLQFVIFITSFLAIAVPLATKKVRWAGFSDNEPRQKAPPRPAKAKAAPKPKVEEEPEDEAPAEEAAADDERPAEEEKPEEPAEEKSAEEPAAEESAGVAVEMQRGTMGKFTQGLLSEVQKSRPQLDAYNRFGVSLMLAGAVDVVGDKNSLQPDERRELLASALTDMGTKKDAAKSFSSKYEEYMSEKRYLGMVQAGRVAAESYLENPAMPLPPMKGLFDAWGKPQSSEAAPRIMAVMFTDMVGSTDMTQAKGDQAAQVIVRRHNSIVRAALNEYGGKQVKHTGDGIMASFPSPGSGVEAAIAIQRACAANNARFPDQELHLRIGINAGEPIQEEEDLFGATVQLAARVCAAAGTDEIVCTNVVRELSGGKGAFSSRGAVALKGFSEKMTLYQVAWN